MSLRLNRRSLRCTMLKLAISSRSSLGIISNASLPTLLLHVSMPLYRQIAWCILRPPSGLPHMPVLQICQGILLIPTYLILVIPNNLDKFLTVHILLITWISHLVPEYVTLRKRQWATVCLHPTRHPLWTDSQGLRLSSSAMTVMFSSSNSHLLLILILKGPSWRTTRQHPPGTQPDPLDNPY